MSKAAIEAYRRSKSGVNVGDLLRRIDSERDAEARRSVDRNQLVDAVGSVATTAAGTRDDFKTAKAGDYKGSFINFITANPAEINPYLELGKKRFADSINLNRGLDQTLVGSENDNNFLDSIGNFGKSIFNRPEDELEGSAEGGDFFGRKRQW